MPRSLDPNNRIVFVLAGDAGKPRETQPRLFGRTLSIGATRKLIVALRSLRGMNDPGASIDAAIDAAMIVLTGWENMIDPATGQSIPFSAESLADVLAIDEITEILEIAANSGRLSVDERKKSESQPLSAAESYVSVAPAAAAE